MAFPQMFNFTLTNIILGLSTILSLVSGLSSLKEEPSSILQELKAECTREGINVKLWFKEPFAGVAYSLGHYETPKCRYISHEDQEQLIMQTSATNYSFLIPMNECGTVYHGSQGSTASQTRKDTRGRDQNNENEVYIENTLLIQNDATIQEARDLAKTLRCVWQKEIHKPLVASFPFGSVNSKFATKRDPFPSSQQSYRVRDVPVKSSYGSSISSSSINYNKGRLRFPMKGQIQSVSAYNNRRQHSRSLPIQITKDDEEVAKEESEEYFPLALSSSREVDEPKPGELKDQGGQMDSISLALPLQGLQLEPNSATIVAYNNAPSLLIQQSKLLLLLSSVLTLIFHGV